MIEALFVLIGALAIVAFFIFWDAFAWGLICWKFWYWFLLPVFNTLPEITFIQSVGLMFFISLFKNHGFPMIKEEYRDNSTTALNAFTMPILVFIVGWFVHVVIVR